MPSTVIPSTPTDSVVSSLQPLLDSKEPKEKKHGLYCRFFNLSDEEYERKRAKREIKNAERMAAKADKNKEFYVPPEELARLRQKVADYNQLREELYPAIELKNDPPKPPKMIKAHNFSGLKGKNLRQHLAAGTDVVGLW